MNERSVDPRALTAAALKTAKNRGVDFSSGDTVTAVNISDGQISGRDDEQDFLPHRQSRRPRWSLVVSTRAPPHPDAARQRPDALPRHASARLDPARHPYTRCLSHSPQRRTHPRRRHSRRSRIRTSAPSPSAIQRPHHVALKLVPNLCESRILDAWAGVRPGTPDNLPILGEAETPGYYVATGHFRDGILLAPITAQAMACAGNQRREAAAGFISILSATLSPNHVILTSERYTVSFPGTHVQKGSCPLGLVRSRFRPQQSAAFSE